MKHVQRDGPVAERTGLLSRLPRALARLALAALLLAGAAGIASPASGAALVSSIGQSDGGTGDLSYFDQAQAFTTGGNAGGYTLTGVEVELSWVVQVSTYDFGIWSSDEEVDAAGDADRLHEPHARLGTLTCPALSVSAYDAVYDCTTAGIDLAADTTYLFVVDSSDGDSTVQLRNTRSDSEDAGAASGWSIGNNSIYRGSAATGGWRSYNQSKKIRIHGTAKPTAANSAPEFAAATLTRTVAENAAANGNVGDAIPAATDADTGNTLTYSMEGADAASFGFDAATRRIATKAGVTYDHEARSTYAVTIRVSDGTASDTVAVTIDVTDVDEPPSAPAALAVSATAGSITSLDVSWTAPANAGKPDIESYDLRYRAGASGSFTDGPRDVTGTSATITGLDADTAYEVQVRATNDEGDGPWSASGEGRTAAPAAAPAVSAQVSTPDLARARWRAELVAGSGASGVTIDGTEARIGSGYRKDEFGTLSNTAFAFDGVTYTVTMMGNASQVVGDSDHTIGSFLMIEPAASAALRAALNRAGVGDARTAFSNADHNVLGSASLFHWPTWTPFDAANASDGANTFQVQISSSSSDAPPPSGYGTPTPSASEETLFSQAMDVGRHTYRWVEPHERVAGFSQRLGLGEIENQDFHPDGHRVPHTVSVLANWSLAGRDFKKLYLEIYPVLPGHSSQWRLWVGSRSYAFNDADHRSYQDGNNSLGPHDSLEWTESDSVVLPDFEQGGTAQVLITRDQGRAIIPRVRIADVTVTEGSTARFQVTLDPPASQRFTVRYRTVDGTAKETEDYQSVESALNFIPGEPGFTIPVSTFENDVDEGEENFFVELVSVEPAGAAIIARRRGMGKIREATAQSQTAADPLTAEFVGLPPVHDGAIDFELRFSEPLKSAFGYAAWGGLLEIAGGSLEKANRIVKSGDDRNRRWAITVSPDAADGDVSIALPPALDCDGESALCTDAGAPLSVGLASIVRHVPASPQAGNAPATGAPAIEGTARVGETLTASVAGIADADGLANARFAYRWLRGEAAIADASASSYVLTAADRGERIRVRVTFMDDAGHLQSLTSAATAEVAAPLLTARWKSAPIAGHDREPFDVELKFSEPVATSYRTMRDHVLRVTDGTVRRAKRVGSSAHWKFTIKPASHRDVTIELPATASCDDEGAVCTGDGRALTQGLAPLVVWGPRALSVSDAGVAEGPGATLDFVLRMNRLPYRGLTVTYETRDGTAVAGADYTATSGTVTFGQDDLEKTVSVPVLDDAVDEGAETMTFVVTGLEGAHSYLLDGEGVGTITNDDPMPRAWLARFGRTLAGQAVDMVGPRLEGGGATQVTVGGQRLDLAGGAAPGEEDLEGALGALGLDGDAGTGATRTMTARELLLGSSFDLAAGGGDGAPAWGAWGRVATGGFEASEDGARMSGSVTSAFLGADVARGGWLAGMALSLSEGTGEYVHEDTGAGGDVESTLTALYPYARLKVNERLDVWGLAGWGTGTLELTHAHPQGVEEEVYRPDIAMRMGALGARGELLAPGAEGGLALALKTDAFWVRTTSEAVRGASAGHGNLAASEADATRLRLTLEGSRRFELAAGSLTPRLELGLRHDGGDAETGSGVELGAGFGYRGEGVTAEGSVRTLIAHEARGYEEWGAAGALRIDPGEAGRGLSLSLAPSWGAAGAGGPERLWSAADARGLAPGGAELEPGRRLEAELGYGFALASDRYTGTPALGLGLGDAGRELRLSWRLAEARRSGLVFGLDAEAARVESAEGPPRHRMGAGLGWRLEGAAPGVALELRLEGERSEAAGGDAPPEHGVGFRIMARW